MRTTPRLWGIVGLALAAVLGLAVWPVRSASGVTASTVAAPSGTMPNATPLSSTPPPNAVLIEDGDNAEKIVRHEPAGTAFVLATGVHGLFSVVPLDGDRFFGQPGTVLDGDHLELTAFKVPHGGTADNVQILGASQSEPLVIENYGKVAHSQVGAVQTNSQTPTPVYSSGWWLQWVEVTGSSARGISLSDNMVILQCTVVGNGRLGIGGAGSGETIIDSTISQNGLTVGDRGWEAGGIKPTGSNVLIAQDRINGNGAPGVWTDGGASDVVIQSNKLTGNRFGIRVEISDHVTVTSNSITRSQQQSVLVIASSNVAVTRNSLSNNFGGIIIGGVGTVNKTGIRLNDVHVTGNSVVDSGATGLHQAPPAGTVIDFDYDHFVGGHLQWDGHGISFSDLQSLGEERHGTWSK
jgi:parallel beta-helix repeat protein